MEKKKQKQDNNPDEDFSTLQTMVDVAREALLKLAPHSWIAENAYQNLERLMRQ